jgi:hypothetical protein
MADLCPVRMVTIEEARTIWPPDNGPPIHYFDEASNVTPEQWRMMAEWPYRNVLRRESANGD